MIHMVMAYHILPSLAMAARLIPPLVSPTTFNYPVAFNFGDSSSNTGGQTFFKKPSGRFCDGRLIIDFLMDAMDLPSLNPHLESVGSPNFRRGCNFAVAGSTVTPATPSSVSPVSFNIQVAQFIRFKARVLDLIGGKLHKYLPRADYFKQGLYMFDIGQNDIAGAFYSKSEDQIIASFPAILVEFETGLKEYTIVISTFLI